MSFVLHLGDCLDPVSGLASLARRFAAKFQPEPNSGCWLWVASVNGDGYGHIGIGGGRVEKAHRAAWLLYRGRIPDGVQVLHRCDTPPCVNPDHLFLGSNADNIKDKVSKGRQRSAPGESNGRAVITAPQAAEIRRRSARGETRTALAREFGVSLSTASRIARGELWRSI